MTYKLPTTWSSQQTAFIDWCVNGNGSCVLEAVAGSGKTTTLLGAVVKMRGPVAILAYNKKIAEEIKQKLLDLRVDWKQALAGTVHSFGFSALRKTFGNLTVDEKKVYNIINDLYAGHPHAAVIVKMVSLAKQRAVGVLSQISDTQVWFDIIDHFDMIDDGFEGDAVVKAIELAKQVLSISNRNTRVIDFDDMVYLPLVHPVRFFQYKVVIVDEAQDTNPARRELVSRLLAKGGRVIAVGDSRQAIYGFTGADGDSLDLIATQFNAIRMPLTITYRCPKAVVGFVHQWVDHIQAAPTAPEGSVSSIALTDAFIPSSSADAILCRNTKPLVALAFSFIRRRIACKIEGRDLGKGLITLANKWKSCKTIDVFEVKLDGWFDKQAARLTDLRLQTVTDQVGTLRAIMGFCREEKKFHMTDVVAWVEDLFADNVKGVVTLSTIHKSKGREWNTVYWLNRASTCPSIYATQPWMVHQEMNLQYVAGTRAMMNLIELEGAI